MQQEIGGAAAENHRSSSVDRSLFAFSRLSGIALNNGREEEVDNIVATGEYSNGENLSESRKRVCSRGHWKPLEDAKLRELVAIYGPQNWNFIAEKLEGRSGKSCRLRWYNQLDPRINKKAFTKEEEERLMEAHRVYGSKWAFISRLFPGRTDNAVKNQWHVMMARKYRQKSKFDIKSSSSTSNSDQQVLESSNNNDPHKCWCMTRETEDSRSKHMLISTTSYSSQISSAASISGSLSVADQYQESSGCLQNSTKPAFIDFLGVGAI